MNAAKVEGRPSEFLCEQSKIIFKIEMSLESFGEVKILTPEKHWEKTKKELMDFVLTYNKKLQGDPNAKLTASQIELLISEGMIKECVSGFPEPDTSSPELLERLWVEVEKKRY